MARKRPAEQWYSGDWFRAVDVRKCSWAVRGIWREMLDIMVNEQEMGKIHGNKPEICRLLGCSRKELDRFFAANSAHNFADVTERNGKVTIICRRLYRAYLGRIGTKKRVQRYRQKGKRNSNADVTPPSSSSTSSSCNNTVTLLLQGTTLQDCYDAAAILGIPEDYAKRFYEHYQPQGWRWGSNVAMTDLRGALQRCRSKGYTFGDKKYEQTKDDRKGSKRDEPFVR